MRDVSRAGADLLRHRKASSPPHLPCAPRHRASPGSADSCLRAHTLALDVKNKHKFKCNESSVIQDLPLCRHLPIASLARSGELLALRFSRSEADHVAQAGSASEISRRDTADRFHRFAQRIGLTLEEIGAELAKLLQIAQRRAAIVRVGPAPGGRGSTSDPELERSGPAQRSIAAAVSRSSLRSQTPRQGRKLDRPTYWWGTPHLARQSPPDRPYMRARSAEAEIARPLGRRRRIGRRRSPPRKTKRERRSAALAPVHRESWSDR